MGNPSTYLPGNLGPAATPISHIFPSALAQVTHQLTEEHQLREHFLGAAGGALGCSGLGGEDTDRDVF